MIGAVPMGVKVVAAVLVLMDVAEVVRVVAQALVKAVACTPALTIVPEVVAVTVLLM